MSSSINKQSLQLMIDEFNKSSKYRLARNAVTNSEIKAVAMNWDSLSVQNHHFSNVITNELPITNQKMTGRCWIFAATNLLRVKIARKYKLENFELSQSYVYFWDKFEKANFFYESIMETSHEPYESRIISHIMKDPVQDGGQWHMFTNLVAKYGLVPQEVYPDTQSCQNSTEMRHILTLKLRQDAIKLRNLSREGKAKAELEKEKEKMMEEVYRILAIHLGPPPTQFNWEFKDKKKKFHAFHDLTPHSFVKNHLPCNLDDYICLVHSPRKEITPFSKTYTIQYLGNVIEGKPIKYLNIEIDQFKKATMKSLVSDEPVWFGCDVAKMFHRDRGIMDLKLYEFDLLYDYSFTMNKEERMLCGESMMTHAMLFTGVNIVQGKPAKWRVENSWGKEKGDKGYFIMSDDWFNEYMFEVAIEKKFLTKELLNLEKQDPIELPAWDPLGALA